MQAASTGRSVRVAHDNERRYGALLAARRDAGQLAHVDEPLHERCWCLLLRHQMQEEKMSLRERVVSRFRKYSQHLRAKPVSFVVSFAILHEITAVLPLPVFYLAFQTIPETYITGWVDHGDLRARADRVLARYNFPLDSRSISSLAASYLVVKALLPVRLGLCIYLAPYAIDSSHLLLCSAAEWSAFGIESRKLWHKLNEALLLRGAFPSK